jgi:hypothetical protein
MENIEVGYSRRMPETIVGETVGDVGEVEGFAIEGYQGRPVTRQMFNSRDERCLFLSNVPQEVLVYYQVTVVDNADPKKDDGAGKETQGLDIKEDVVTRLMEACGSQDGGMGFRMPVADQVHDLGGITI